MNEAYLKLLKLNLCVKKKQLLKDISFELLSKDKLCILGQNGSSKSTLLRCLVGLLDFSGGYYLKGVKVDKNKLYKSLAFVSQSPSLEFNYSLFELVLMGRYAKSSGIFYSKKDKMIAFKCLELLGIKELARQSFHTLSGGQQQLGFIARALCKQSRILILDEPSSALDLSRSAMLFKTLASLDLDLLIFTTHDPLHAVIANKILMLKAGELLGFGPTKSLLNTSYINELYGVDTTMSELENGARLFYCK